MAWVASAIAVAGIGVGLASSAAASNAAQQQAEEQIAANTYEGRLQQLMKEQEAEENRKYAQAQASKIKSAAQYTRGAQTAQAAASGVIVGEGSAQVMQDRTTQLALEDALAALYSGGKAAVNASIQGQFAQMTADQRSLAAANANSAQQTAIAGNALQTVFSGASTLYGNWQKSQLTTNK